MGKISFVLNGVTILKTKNESKLRSKKNSDFAKYFMSNGPFENCGDCRGCELLSFAVPRRGNMTDEEYNAKIEKLKKDPMHSLYEGVREPIECKNKERIKEIEKGIYQLEKEIGITPSIHGTGGEA